VVAVRGMSMLAPSGVVEAHPVAVHAAVTEPAQWPLPSQISFVVHAMASSHAEPGGRGV